MLLKIIPNCWPECRSHTIFSKQNSRSPGRILFSQKGPKTSGKGTIKHIYIKARVKKTIPFYGQNGKNQLKSMLKNHSYPLGPHTYIARIREYPRSKTHTIGHKKQYSLQKWVPPPDDVIVWVNWNYLLYKDDKFFFNFGRTHEEQTEPHTNDCCSLKFNSQSIWRKRTEPNLQNSYCDRCRSLNFSGKCTCQKTPKVAYLTGSQ